MGETGLPSVREWQTKLVGTGLRRWWSIAQSEQLIVYGMRRLARYFLVWIGRELSPDGHGNGPGGYKCLIPYRNRDTYIFYLHRRFSVALTFISLFSGFTLFEHLVDGKFRIVGAEWLDVQYTTVFQRPSLNLFSGWIPNSRRRIPKIIVMLKSSFKRLNGVLFGF